MAAQSTLIQGRPHHSVLRNRWQVPEQAMPTVTTHHNAGDDSVRLDVDAGEVSSVVLSACSEYVQSTNERQRFKVTCSC